MTDTKWRTRPLNVGAAGDSGNLMVWVADDCGNDVCLMAPNGDQLATAYLFRAAPELYELLDLAVAVARAAENKEPLPDLLDYCDWLIKSEETLAKARGES